MPRVVLVLFLSCHGSKRWSFWFSMSTETKCTRSFWFVWSAFISRWLSKRCNSVQDWSIISVDLHLSWRWILLLRMRNKLLSWPFNIDFNWWILQNWAYIFLLRLWRIPFKSCRNSWNCRFRCNCRLCTWDERWPIRKYLRLYSHHVELIHIFVSLNQFAFWFRWFANETVTQLALTVFNFVLLKRLLIRINLKFFIVIKECLANNLLWRIKKYCSATN